ncbi:hypothetical protein NDS46_29915 (plasmid) [Paenibacillus thiaminolyticus]|uniref:hypothetical protein n=1 Tax=Paenibacillus thiaminolyticus TaxID=49283 RepID=UPI00232BAC98|nr:hypothetical protein [Paenibacillus thiaminolyticus]WCF11565.1 hypothetical protein NDS46_29915 [Paenibacillus thiaminolyticus]
MSLYEIRKITEISEEYIKRLEDAGLGQHILSVQREYVQHVGEILKAYDGLLMALNKIDTHGIAVEEASHEELVEFIVELKEFANEALINVGERLPTRN